MKRNKKQKEKLPLEIINDQIEEDATLVPPYLDFKSDYRSFVLFRQSMNLIKILASDSEAPAYVIEEVNGNVGICLDEVKYISEVINKDNKYDLMIQDIKSKIHDYIDGSIQMFQFNSAANLTKLKNYTMDNAIYRS